MQKDRGAYGVRYSRVCGIIYGFFPPRLISVFTKTKSPASLGGSQKLTASRRKVRPREPLTSVL